MSSFRKYNVPKISRLEGTEPVGPGYGVLKLLKEPHVSQHTFYQNVNFLIRVLQLLLSSYLFMR